MQVVYMHALPIYDNQKCLQTQPNVPWEEKSPLLENHSSKWSSGLELSAMTFFLLYPCIGLAHFSQHLNTAYMLRTPKFTSLPVSPQIQITTFSTEQITENSQNLHS